MALRVVCGTGETMLIFSPLAVFKKVDLPADGRPTIETSAVFSPTGGSASSKFSADSSTKFFLLKFSFAEFSASNFFSEFFSSKFSAEFFSADSSIKFF
jgi:hypothetical protein